MTAEAMYALYRGDEFVDVGTADEIAKRRGIKPESVKWMSTPSYRKRGREDKLTAYRIEDGR